MEAVEMWPSELLERVFTLLDLKSVCRCEQVCRRWRLLLSDENSRIWHSLLHSRQPPNNSNQPFNLLLQSLPSAKSRLRALSHTWDPLALSPNAFVKNRGLTVHRNPVAQSSDGARGKIGFISGRHAWEIVWEGPLGTVAVVGVANDRASVHAQGYVALLGNDNNGWGWNLVDNRLVHDGKQLKNYPCANNAPKYQVGERLRVILDCDDQTLMFERGYEFLGVAFNDLPSHQRLYPCISAVYGKTEVSMVYLGPPLDG